MLAVRRGGLSGRWQVAVLTVESGTFAMTHKMTEVIELVAVAISRDLQGSRLC